MVCSDCPRRCGVDRATNHGFCKMGELPVVARAALHDWEEPPISGTRGSGAVFFSGCNMQCVYCQNREISRGGKGKEVTVERLREIYGELIAQGAHNINLVTGSHFVRPIAASLSPALPVPVVWNCGGYESSEALRLLDGKVQIYLPDLKYADNALAVKYSNAPDYFETATAAIREMFRQVGPCQTDENGLLTSGVVLRHMMLPGCVENTKKVIDWVADTFSDGDILFSFMSQYTPNGTCTADALGRRLTPEEYAAAADYLFAAGIEDGFMQELSSAKEEYVPPFDLTGV